MEKRRGFTLIELLAVIVILAIIALIAVPTVMNIISRAQKSAFKDSAYGIMKAGELYYTNQLLEPTGMTEDKTFTFPNAAVDLEINGSKPTGGSMTVTKDGKVEMAITNGRYCVTKGINDDDVTIKEDDGNCVPTVAEKKLSDVATTYTFTSPNGVQDASATTVPACATSGICEAGTPFAIKVNDTETYKFYVLSDNGTKVTLIMDRNLYSEIEDANQNEFCWKNDRDTTQGPVQALEVLRTGTNDWTNITEYSYTLENDYGDYNYDPVELTDVRARLPKYSEIYDLNDSTDLTNSSWLYDNDPWLGYWTSTASDHEQAYYVTEQDRCGGNLTDEVFASGQVGCVMFPVDSPNGIRPVIEISK